MLMIVHENHLKTIVSTQLFNNYFNSTESDVGGV